jgi:hypothetical protein
METTKDLSSDEIDRAYSLGESKAGPHPKGVVFGVAFGWIAAGIAAIAMHNAVAVPLVIWGACIGFGYLLDREHDNKRAQAIDDAIRHVRSERR